MNIFYQTLKHGIYLEVSLNLSSFTGGLIFIKRVPLWVPTGDSFLSIFYFISWIHIWKQSNINLLRDGQN